MIDFADRVAKLLAAGDAEAASQLVESVAQQPGNYELGHAVLALFRKDPTAGIAHAERALKLGAGAAGHQYLAMSYLMLGDGATAIDHARKAVALDASVRSRGGLGSVLLVAGRPDDAAAVLRQVVAESPSDAEAHLNLATASSQLTDYGEAITHYARAFDLNPDDQRPIQNLVTMFADVGRWLGAVAALELSRKGEPPPDVAVALDLVMVHLVRLIATKFPQPGIADDADESVRNLISNAQLRGVRTQLIVARTLVDFGRLDDARKLVEDLDRQPALGVAQRGSLLYLKGFLAERADDKPRALELYGEALAADAERVDACINTISLLLEDGSPAAFQRIGALLEKTPKTQRGNSPELMFNESVYLARSGKPAEARANLERLLRVTGGEGRMAMMAKKALEEFGKSS